MGKKSSMSFLSRETGFPLRFNLIDRGVSIQLFLTQRRKKRKVRKEKK
jgi:hypothetical protein